MAQPDFGEYLTSICSGIKSKTIRLETEEELLCHLEDNYERNLAIGMSEEEAKNDAINKMGDRELLRYRLSAIHSVSPLKAMSSAFGLLILSYIMMNFIFTGAVKHILYIAGIILMFSPVLRMRKMNATTEKAFHLFNLFVLSKLFFYCIGLGRILPFWISSIGYVFVNTAQAFFWFFLFKGLYDFCQPYRNEESKNPHLIFCAVYQFLLYGFTGIILVMSEGESVTFELPIIGFLPIIVYIFTIVQLVRARRILWDADGEYGILPANKKHFRIYAGVLIACLFTTLTFNYLSSTREPIKTELVIHDLSLQEQEEAEKVRQRMHSWDIPEAVVEDLPDSEILKYKDAAFVTWDSTGGSYINSEGHSSQAAVMAWNYWFFIPVDGHPEHYDVRLLNFIESHYSDKAKGLYRRGFYMAPWDNIMPYNAHTKNNGAFISIVTEEGGKKYTAEPFILLNFDDENITTWPKGFEYREEKEQRVYFAMDLGINCMSDNAIIQQVSIRKNCFFSLGHNTTADYAKKNIEYGRITLFGDDTFFSSRGHSTTSAGFTNEDIAAMKEAAKTE